MPRRKPTSAGAAPGERAVLLTAALGTMLMPLNSTMIAVALPDVVDDLDVSLGSTAWLVSGYLIAQASLQPLAGKLGDQLGQAADPGGARLVRVGVARRRPRPQPRGPDRLPGGQPSRARSCSRDHRPAGLPEARRGLRDHRLCHRARGGGRASARRPARRARRLAAIFSSTCPGSRWRSGSRSARFRAASQRPIGALRSRRRRRAEPAARGPPGSSTPATSRAGQFSPRRLRSCCSS